MKTIGFERRASSRVRKLMLAALAASALATGLAAGPALADPPRHKAHWDRGYHRGWERHYWGPRGYVYWAPGYVYPPPPVVYAPPPVYYAPPPPPVYYGAPSLNVVIPIR
ncbi:MAG: hypothetical protein WBG82_13515 [Parvibaculum sp.]|uniref:hypothetical protein n=1 Tax=Parvibaculum sp. TaxID=2024848 RepID=UPI003C790321